MGLCLFFIALSIGVFITLSVAAKSGHGGDTLVKAHVGQPASDVSEETQPESDTHPISEDDGSPASTGDTAPVYSAALALMIVSASVLVGAGILGKKRPEKVADFFTEDSQDRHI